MKQTVAAPKRMIYWMLAIAGILGALLWLMTDIAAFLVFPLLGVVVAVVVRFALR